MSGLLPDPTPVKELLERIAQEKKWSKEAVESDCAILDRNRLVYVQDLRALSRESWAQIELLPLVKDLLRGEIDPEWNTAHNLSNINNNNNDNNNVESASSGEENNIKKKDKKEKKKDEEGKKKDKKKKDKQKQKGFKSPSLLGTPVVPTILSRPSPPIHDLQQGSGDTSSILSDSSLSQDPITVQNTIRNGNIIDVTPALPTPINTQRGLSVNTTTTTTTTSSSPGGTNSSSDYDEVDDDELLSPSSRKCVTFSNETAIGIAASVKTDAEKEKKKEKKKDKKKKNKDVASINKYSGYTNFTNHPYTTHPIVKFKKMKMKHCKRLPEVPKDDLFLQRIHDRLKLSTDS